MSLVSFMSESMSAEQSSLMFNPLSNIVRSIIADANGCWLDPSDMSTMFQDAAGTTPVTAVEQPVGKIIDKSGNGNHATQSVTASRPVLSARYNLLTKTEDFSDAVWSSTVNMSVTPNIIYAPDGMLSVDKITITDTNYAYKRYQIAVLPSTKYTLSYYLETTLSASGCRYRVYDLTNATNIVSETDCDYSGGGFVRQAITFTTPANCTSIFVYVVANSPPYAGAYYYIWGADLRLGTSAGPYQRVNTATDYDTDERYFPKYLRFDGVDDYLNLPYMGLYAGGGASIITGRDALSQATDTYIISERSTTDADPKYFPSRQLANGGNMDAYISDDTAAVVLDTVGSAFGGAADKVIRSVVDTGSNLKLYKNGAVAASDNYTRAGTLTLNTTTIGASVSTTTSNYAKMNLYGLLITKSALTDAQRIACERHLSRKAGVAL